MTWFQWLVSWLVWLSADPVAADLEVPRAAAAVAAARASMLPDAPPVPAPTPMDCECGKTCVNGVWKPDGRVEQICRCECDRCKRSRGQGRIQESDCKDGSCRVSSSAGR